MVSPKDARSILVAIRPMNVERQLTFLTWIVAYLAWDKQNPETKPEHPTGTLEEHDAWDSMYETTSAMPWGRGDDTFQAVIEVLEQDEHGVCDACQQYGAMRKGEAGGTETSQCKWGCDDAG